MPEGDGGHAAPPQQRQSDAGRPPGRRLRRLTGALVLVVLLAAGLSYEFDLGARWFGFDYPSPVTEPAEVPPPPGLSLPEAEQAEQVAEPTPPVDADPDAVRRAVARLAGRKKLGPDVAVAVTQLSDGQPVYRDGPDRVTPASLMKLLTGAAALSKLGPDHRFNTTVVSGRPGRITLVGGGDPFLASAPAPVGETYPARADIQTLARATAKALRGQGRSRVRLRYDTSLFEGPAASPTWPASYLPDNVVSPIGALWVDEGRRFGGSVRSDDPAADAARAFAAALEKRKIRVVKEPKEKPAPADAGKLAEVESAPLSQLVQRIVEVSDNEGAEVLARHVALAAGEPASFDGIAPAYAAVLGELGVDSRHDRIHDGSGLSRKDRLDPETLLALIRVASGPDHPELRPLLAGLPVAGFTGSLTYRFDTGAPEGLGAVRAKTGTLSGVHGLAGTVTTTDGVVLGFVAVADEVKLPNTLDARATLDRLAAALAACTCGSAT